MNATPAEQRILLDVVDIDRRLIQAQAQRKNPPQAPRIAELVSARQAQNHELGQRAGAQDDLRTELSRIESDVKTAQARLARDEQRLTTASAKEAVALESEIASLRRRLEKLEDAQLEAMERLEAVDISVAEQEARVAEITAEGQALSAEAKALVADASARFEQLERDRVAVTAQVSEALLTQYARIARNTIGAGLFRDNMCEACHVLLSGSDLAVVRAAAENAVIFCPSCGAILVRTEESGY